MEGGSPSLLQLAEAAAVGACVLVFLASFFATWYLTLLIGVRTGAMIELPEERGLSWGERAGRKNSRGNRFWVADEFRSLRRLYFGAIASLIGSAVLAWLLLALFAGRLRIPGL
jgi:hypothetical protein